MTQTHETRRAVDAAGLGKLSFRSRIDNRDLTETNAELQAQSAAPRSVKASAIKAARKYYGDFARFS